ncbi:MAG: tetratricopeptide repeat protein, partial [Candidatus Aminicenantes bacterium]|nr:tetratricopeptide repeat protein [Candidatus Aminicenantes bacterium]NIQ70228.1 tetratricopeptide repeat protein [Candidatus Aminicenantes bacterium]NIT26259.1 tetratricopeptide repeat protein [Candidatus Aminicenantes bacterium]
DQASATIERALRIEPKNPLLWQRLGYLHLQNHRWQQAIAMAQKSNTLAGGNRQLMVTNWKIIARAKNKIGDEQGAKEAEKIIQTLEN